MGLLQGAGESRFTGSGKRVGMEPRSWRSPAPIAAVCVLVIPACCAFDSQALALPILPLPRPLGPPAHFPARSVSAGVWQDESGDRAWERGGPAKLGQG